MTDQYLWDRSGEADEFVAELERGLAPLGDEADAILDELELEDEAEAEVDEAEAEDADAMVVVLPTARAAAAAEAKQAGRRWMWMSAAAALLLSFSALTLAREARRGSGTTVQVGGNQSPALARVELGVDGVPDATAARALTELRPLHAELAGCARDWVRADRDGGREALKLRASVELGSGSELEAEGGQLDEGTRACVERAFAGWQPAGLGPGTLEITVNVQAEANDEDE